MIIYLDTCCYCRPFDNRAHYAQERVRQEITAIMDIVRMCGMSGTPILGSVIVSAEIDDIGNYGKRERVRGFYGEVISEELKITDSVTVRAQELNALGLGGRDAYHTAFSEAVGVAFVLTTDDRFQRVADKIVLRTKVINPINFLGEYLIWQLSLT